MTMKTTASKFIILTDFITKINGDTNGELKKEKTMRKFGNSEFSTKPTYFYDLDMIISVGYKVRSQRGVEFRIWASAIIREYMKKGFAMDDDR